MRACVGACVCLFEQENKYHGEHQEDAVCFCASFVGSKLSFKLNYRIN